MITVMAYQLILQTVSNYIAILFSSPSLAEGDGEEALAELVIVVTIGDVIDVAACNALWDTKHSDPDVVDSGCF